MSNDGKNQSAPTRIVLRVTFAEPTKLGGDELKTWHRDRHTRFTCEATPQGLVFTQVNGEGDEIVIPYTNVRGYERGAPKAKKVVS